MVLMGERFDSATGATARRSRSAARSREQEMETFKVGQRVRSKGSNGFTVGAKGTVDQSSADCVGVRVRPSGMDQAWCGPPEAAADRWEDLEVTPVLFRVWRGNEGGVVALFPAELGVIGDHGSCSSYMHVGQHGNASLHGVIQATRSATEAEYADLKRELESPPYGYELRVYMRATKGHRKARMESFR